MKSSKWDQGRHLQLAKCKFTTTSFTCSNFLFSNGTALRLYVYWMIDMCHWEDRQS